MDNHFLQHLTAVGREIAEKTYERHCFFTNQLVAMEIDFAAAEENACRLEHAISDKSFRALKEKPALSAKR